jgi:uncharacterized protein (DUF58 family)
MIHTLGYPLLFHGVFLGALVALVLFAAVRDRVPLLVFSLSFLIFAAASWIWSRRSVQGISLEVALSGTRAFPDESIEILFKLRNGKWLPLPWLEIEQAIPRRLTTGRPGFTSPLGKERLRWTTAISGRQGLNWRYSLECRARGEYRLGPLRLRSGDMFGLFPREIIIPQSHAILVYPRILPVERLNLSLKEVLGELATSRGFYEDPNRPTGPRDYQPHDAFKRIHWKATARQGRLHVRQFESSTGLSILLLLDVESFCGQGQKDEEVFENAVTLTASLAYDLCGEKWPVGLMANSLPEIDIPVSSDRSQLLFLLEALARVQWRSGPPLCNLLERERAGFHVGTTLVIITYLSSPRLAALMGELRKRGHSLFLVTLGNGQSGHGLDGIPAFQAPPLDGPIARGKASS